MKWQPVKSEAHFFEPHPSCIGHNDRTDEPAGRNELH